MRLQRAHVIGMGEVGRRIASALRTAGVDVLEVTRTENWDSTSGEDDAPRIICVREEALPEVLDRLSGVPSRCLVPVQNGWIRPLLGDADDATRGLIWFTSKGEFYRQLRPSPFSGPFAETLVPALARGGLSVQSLNREDFDAADAEKMGFNCVVGLPLAVHGVNLGDYLTAHRDEAHAVFTEAVDVCSAAAGCQADPTWWEHFLTAVEPLDWVATSQAKALEYRNGAVIDLARRLGISTPENDRLMAAG